MPIRKKISEIIRTRKQDIIDAWVMKSRARIPPAKDQELYALLNSVPLVLDAFIDAFAPDAPIDSSRRLEYELASVHGLCRSQQDGYTTEYVAHEYLILKNTLFEFLEEENGQLPRDVYDKIMDNLDFASESAQQNFLQSKLVKQKAKDEPWHLSESLYRTIIEEVEEYAIFMVDLNGHVVSWNKGTLKIKGYLPHEILGQPFRTLFTEEDASVGRPEWEMDYALKHGRYAGEGWRQRKDGSRFWASVVLTAIRSDTDELIGWCKITRDLTAEKKAEEELRKAEEATRAKSTFLANMSHEIRTPLGAIMGFVDLILDEDAEPDEKKEYASTIRRNGEQLAALIDDILDLSKIEAGKLDVDKSSFDVSEFLEDIYRTLHPKAMDKGLRLEFESLSGTPKIILSDRLRLRQILLNVINNAIKFTDRGTVRVEIETRPAAYADVEDILRFTIIDTGMGISMEYQKRLFSPFTQAHTSKTKLFGGTGLGLSLSRQLARALGGDLILVESRPGEGSTFLVSIAAGKKLKDNWIEDPLGTSQGVPRVDQGEKEAKTLDGVRILLAEDAKDNQLMISTFLKSLQAEVQIVENGQQAIDIVSETTFDLVLMDIQMPLVDGYDAMSTIRTRGYSGPIVALTALAMKDDRDRGRAAGFDEYLTKPVNRSALLKTINSLIIKRRKTIIDVANRNSGQSSAETTGSIH